MKRAPLHLLTEGKRNSNWQRRGEIVIGALLLFSAYLQFENAFSEEKVVMLCLQLVSGIVFSSIGILYIFGISLLRNKNYELILGARNYRIQSNCKGWIVSEGPISELQVAKNHDGYTLQARGSNRYQLYLEETPPDCLARLGEHLSAAPNHFIR